MGLEGQAELIDACCEVHSDGTHLFYTCVHHGLKFCDTTPVVFMNNRQYHAWTHLIPHTPPVFHNSFFTPIIESSCLGY